MSSNIPSTAELHCFLGEMYLTIRNKDRALKIAHFSIPLCRMLQSSEGESTVMIKLVTPFVSRSLESPLPKCSAKANGLKYETDICLLSFIHSFIQQMFIV